MLPASMGTDQSSASAVRTDSTARSTSLSFVFQLHTDTRIHRLPRQVVPLKSASPFLRVAAITLFVHRS